MLLLDQAVTSMAPSTTAAPRRGPVRALVLDLSPPCKAWAAARSGATLTTKPSPSSGRAASAPAGLADCCVGNRPGVLYAVPVDNLPPQLAVAGVALIPKPPQPPCCRMPGRQPWTADIEARRPRRHPLLLVAHPRTGRRHLSPSVAIASDVDGLPQLRQFAWTPTATAAADTEIPGAVRDSRGGGVAIKASSSLSLRQITPR